MVATGTPMANTTAMAIASLVTGALNSISPRPTNMFRPRPLTHAIIPTMASIPTVTQVATVMAVELTLQMFLATQASDLDPNTRLTPLKISM